MTFPSNTHHCDRRLYYWVRPPGYIHICACSSARISPWSWFLYCLRFTHWLYHFQSWYKLRPICWWHPAVYSCFCVTLHL